MRFKYSKLLVLLLGLYSGSLLAAPSTIKPFSAQYDVYRNSHKIGQADFDLAFANGSWLWRMDTQPVAPYKWLSRKKPFSESRMRQHDDGLLLSEERRGNYAGKPAREKTWFDHQKQSIYYSRDKKQRQLDLPSTLYNFHSIHLLAASMRQQGELNKTIKFYRKGKVYNSELTLERGQSLMHDNRQHNADRLSQTLDQADYRMEYYYDANTLAPLKIVRINDNGDTRSLWRNAVK